MVRALFAEIQIRRRLHPICGGFQSRKQRALRLMRRRQQRMWARAEFIFWRLLIALANSTQFHSHLPRHNNILTGRFYPANKAYIKPEWRAARALARASDLFDIWLAPVAAASKIPCSRAPTTASNSTNCCGAKLSHQQVVTFICPKKVGKKLVSSFERKVLCLFVGNPIHFLKFSSFCVQLLFQLCLFKS